MTDLAILDVGHGNCAVLQDGPRALLVDCGPGAAILSHLDQQRVEVIEEALISHTDADHLRGLQRILDEDRFQLGRVRINSDAAQVSELWSSLAFSLDDRRRSGDLELTSELVEGAAIPFAEDCHIRVLAPRSALAMRGPGANDDQGRRISGNTISAVISLEVQGQRVLLPGDLDDVGLDHLLMSGQDLRSDILVFPHHGGNVRANATVRQNTAFAERLLSAVSPSLVLFSFGRSKHRNPRPEVVDAARSSGECQIMCTQMSLHCSSAETFDGDHLADVFASGRRHKHCCAGSISITATGMMPSPQVHRGFVVRSASNALCLAGGTRSV